jgi:hypothetical protein
MFPSSSRHTSRADSRNTNAVRVELRSENGLNPTVRIEHQWGVTELDFSTHGVVPTSWVALLNPATEIFSYEYAGVSISVGGGAFAVLIQTDWGPTMMLFPVEAFAEAFMLADAILLSDCVE